MNKPKAPTRKEMDASYARQLQVDIEEDIALSSQEALRGPISRNVRDWAGELLNSLPASCPACGAGNLTGRFDIWTHMKHHDDMPARIMCGACGVTKLVTMPVWLEAQAARKDVHDRLNRRAPKKEKRERGGE